MWVVGKGDFLLHGSSPEHRKERGLSRVLVSPPSLAPGVHVCVRWDFGAVAVSRFLAPLHSLNTFPNTLLIGTQRFLKSKLMLCRSRWRTLSSSEGKGGTILRLLNARGGILQRVELAFTNVIVVVWSLRCVMMLELHVVEYFEYLALDYLVWVIAAYLYLIKWVLFPGLTVFLYLMYQYWEQTRSHNIRRTQWICCEVLWTTRK